MPVGDTPRLGVGFTDERRMPGDRAIVPFRCRTPCSSQHGVGQFWTTVNTEEGVQGSDVGAYRVDGDIQVAGDLLVREPLDPEVEDLPLPRRQRVERIVGSIGIQCTCGSLPLTCSRATTCFFVALSI